MEQYGPFIGGALLVALLGFIAYKVKESRDKKPSGGSGGGKPRPGTKPK